MTQLSFTSEEGKSKSNAVQVTGDFGLQLNLPREGCKVTIRQSMNGSDFMAVKEARIVGKTLAVGVYYVIPSSYIVIEVDAEDVQGSILM